jgi:Protein of unknown function (DUF2637)
MVRGITTLAALAVALVAAVASYDHRRALAALASEGWRAGLLPVSVDGLIIAANVAAAEPTMVGRVVAAWPPVSLLLAWNLLMQVRAPAIGDSRS